VNDIDPIMQAAERQRRIKNGEHASKVYEQDAWQRGQSVADLLRLADFAMSAIPTGDRPVPMSEDDMKHGETVHCLNDYGYCFPQVVSRFIGRTDVMVGSPNVDHLNFARVFTIYRTADEARLANHWRRFEALVEIAPLAS
jgi:hypothetical protein